MNDKVTQQKNTNFFIELFSKMDPKKSSDFLCWLYNRKNNPDNNPNYFETALKSLYMQSEQPQYDQFQEFLKNNQIKFLGGGGSSKNFKITPLNGSSCYVLKINKQLGESPAAEEHLRNTPSLKEIFTPIIAETKIAVENSRNMPDFSLVLTEFCSQGDLFSQASWISLNKQENAVIIYRQMADTLEKIRLAGCAFTDMKNTNWLIDEKNAIRIADTKSLVFTEDGNVNNQRGIIHTVGLSAPEYREQSFFSADKMHSFILGKNLYQYLTGGSDYEFEHRDSADELNFNSPVFQRGDGIKLKNLITGMVQEQPNQRISVADALKELNNIKSVKERCADMLKSIVEDDEEKKLYQGIIEKFDCMTANQQTPLEAYCNLENYIIIKRRNYYLDVLKNINGLKFGETDETFNEFFTILKTTVLHADTLEKFDDIKASIRQLSNPQAKEIHTIIQSFREGVGFARKDKANAIEKAMAQVPIAERANILDGTTEAAKKVKEQLASHRTMFGGLEIHKTQNGALDEEKAAGTFKNFKNKMTELKQSNDNKNTAVETADEDDAVLINLKL